MTVGATRAGSGAAARDTMKSRLYGRERELGVLNRLTSRLYQNAGGAVVVRGEAGIGKSALLAAVSAQARRHGARVLTAAGLA